MSDQPMRLHVEELDEESGRTRNIEIDYGESEVRVGRDRACAIVLESPSASRRHCSFLQKPDGWYVVDLGSTLGTFYNGTKLTPEAPQKLDHGDTINCSTHQLRVSLVPLTDPTLRPDPNALSRLMEGFENEEDSPPRVWVFAGDASGVGLAGGADAAGPAGSRPDAPGCFPLAEEGAVLSVGRSAECDIRLDDPFRVVSAVHARFERNWAGVFLFDASINGIYVNGKRVEGQVQIQDGDRITIAAAEEEPVRPLLVFADAGNSTTPSGQSGALGGALPASPIAAATPERPAPPASTPEAAVPPPGPVAAAGPSPARATPDAPSAEKPETPGSGRGFFGASDPESEGGERGAFSAGTGSVPDAAGLSRPTTGTGRPPINWLLVAVIAVSALALVTVLVWGLILLRG